MTALRFVSMHQTLFMPGSDGKAVNFKDKLDVDSIEGKRVGLKMSLQGDAVYIETSNSYGFIPVSNCILLVPLERLKTETKGA